MDHTDPTADFWESSSLNRYVFRQFASRLTAYDELSGAPNPMALSAAPVELPVKRDNFQKILEKRRSTRSFGTSPLTFRQLGQVLSAMGPAVGSSGLRLYPSAGGLGAVEVFALLDRVEGPLGRVAARLNPTASSLTPMVALPPAATLDELCTLEGTAPALVLVFALRFDQLQAKYGDRGVRFGLIELGHACQNVALRLAVEDLAGYQLGGVLDTELEELLGIGEGRAQVTLGYAIGPRG